MGRMIRLAVAATTCVVAVAVFGPGQASAEFGVENFEAGTCAINNDPVAQCTYGSDSSWFYTQAGGHPPFGIIDFTFNTDGSGFPEGNVRNVRTDLPLGLSVNPEAVPKCTEEQLLVDDCPDGSQVGTNWVTSTSPPVPLDPPLLPLDVYNMVPPDGKPLMAGFLVPFVNERVYLVGDVEWEGDYHQFFTISDIGDTIPVVRNRMVFDGEAGDGFIRLPTQCSDAGETTHLAVAPHGDADNFLHYSATTPEGVDGCENVPFSPEISVAPASDQTDSPSGVSIEVTNPDPGGAIRPADVRHASVSLPEGMNLNASAINGLGTCTNAQFGKGTRNSINCPASSRVGSAAIETPSLPAGSLTGNVYIGQPLNNNPASGQQFRLFVEASSARYGVSVRLMGNVVVDPDTGRLTTNFTNLPQAPSSSVMVNLDGGPRAVLSTPATCGPHTTEATFVPWSGTGATQSTSSFSLSRAPGGGDCAPNSASRPFDPGFFGTSSNFTSAQFTNPAMRFTRNDGEQEIKRIDLTLPAGMLARLTGVPYCSEQAMAAAAGRHGRAEQASPSCPNASWIGRVGLALGTGTDLFPVMGHAYLAGPYAGAPLSMVVVTPAVAGPYDLGTVVVRVALHVDPVTLEIRAISDPIPHRVRGVNLGIRSVIVAIDRDRFNINPTGCWEKFFSGSVSGGGGNPASPAAWSTRNVLGGYEATQCARLGFAPSIRTGLVANRKQLRRSGHPPFRAVVVPPRHHANIRKASVRMPRSIQLDQSNIRTVCTRQQWAERDCPRAAIYGWAIAQTPLLDEPLRGPVYLRSSDNPLPDLVADLRGQVNVELAGRIDSFRGMIRTVYSFVADARIRAFALQLKGGPRQGLLVANRDLCQRRWGVSSAFMGHNLKVDRTRSLLRMRCR